MADLLQIRPGGDASPQGQMVKVYTLKLSRPAYEPTIVEPLYTTVVGGHFVVSSDVNPQSDKNIDETILPNTHVYYESARRTALRDPLLAINSDPTAKEIIRTAPAAARFVVVSEAWSGSRILTYFLDPKSFFAANMLGSSGRYLYVRYSCAPFRFYLDRRNSEHPLLFAYTPIKWNPVSSTVQPDGRPLEAEGFSFQSPPE